MRTRNTFKCLQAISFLLTALTSMPAYAYNCDNWVAKLQSAQGSVQLRQTNKQWQQVSRNDSFCKGDVLRVQENSRAALLLRNDTLLRLNQNTTITFTNLSPDKPSVVSIDAGFAHFISRVKAAFEVITPFINAAIEGTEFVVAVKNNQAEVTVFEGSVRAYNQLGEVRLKANQTALAKKGQAPVLILKAKPRDAVNWSLYYPTILTTQTEPLLAQASQALSIGEVNKAKTLLQEILKQSATHSSALAMQAIISIVQNNKALGLKQAQQAVAANNKNATAKLALSYAHQAHFNIDEALKVLQQAIKDEPRNALVWSRLAEVYLMHSELDDALNTAKKANALNPELGRTHTVLGFAYLTRIEIKQAQSSFNTAIEKNQADPLARLGLGLTMIRQGNLEQGRQQIEYAATLDPNNALIRSYLGKAYYEEKRNKLAAVQFEMAKELDPNDPTAYFYNAIRLQSENKPGKALQEIDKATQLNQRRAIYRSKLLLDQDQAVRNSSTAQIYAELGFNNIAILEANQALQKDYTNYSAHRFLSEAYARAGRNNIARVSEIYQSILFSPLNTSAIPPHIAETDLGIISNAGPADASLNEYDSLFTRNGSQWRTTLLAGNNQTLGDEIIYSAIKDNFAINLGQYSYRTDGFRENNDLKQDIVNMFFQWAIDSKQSIQLEVIDSSKENGDLRLNFDPTSFTNRRETEDKNSLRLGYLYKPTSNLDFVTSVTLQSKDSTRESSTSFNTTLDLVDGFDAKETIHNSELQFVYKKNTSQTIFGAGNYVNNASRDTVFLLRNKTTGATAVDLSSTKSSTITHTNAYIYEMFSMLNINFLLGVSNDDYDDNINNIHTNSTNPKFGAQVKFGSNTLQFAAFNTLQRSLTNNQTLEPTNIFGFTQFYNDTNSTIAHNLAIGLNNKISTNINSGINFTKRDLRVPIIKNSEQVNEGQKEYIANAYFNWLVNTQFAINIGVEYLDQEREYVNPVSISVPLSMTTIKYPLNIIYNHDSRMSYTLTTTYYDQDVIQPISSSENNALHDSFTIVDTAISYKLEKRKGKLSFVINNLFDTQFNYQDTTFRNALAQQPTIQHERGITFRATFNF